MPGRESLTEIGDLLAIVPAILGFGWWGQGYGLAGSADARAAPGRVFDLIQMLNQSGAVSVVVLHYLGINVLPKSSTG